MGGGDSRFDGLRASLHDRTCRKWVRIRLHAQVAAFKACAIAARALERWSRGWARWRSRVDLNRVPSSAGAGSRALQLPLLLHLSPLSMRYFH